MSNVVSMRRRSPINVIRLAGDEYPGAQGGAYAIFGPLSACAQYPVLALVNHEHELFIDRAAPHPDGVRLATGEMLVDAAMIGLLVATAATRELAAAAIRQLEDELSIARAQLASTL